MAIVEEREDGWKRVVHAGPAVIRQKRVAATARARKRMRKFNTRPTKISFWFKCDTPGVVPIIRVSFRGSGEISQMLKIDNFISAGQVLYVAQTQMEY
jgi:hypothetical protein